MMIQVITRYYFLLLLALLLPIIAQGQNIQYPEQLQWSNIIEDKISDNTIRYITFKGASLEINQKSTAQYQNRIPINSLNNVYNINIDKQRWKTLTNEELHTIDTTLIADTLIVHIANEETAKQAYLNISFFPFRKNGQQIEKLISCEIVAKQIGTNTKHRKSNTYSAESILKQGNFYRMAITQTGIHKITYNNLTAMGIPTPIYTKNIALFGNGGQELPQSTSEKVFDDLIEVPIEINDNNANGILDADDYILFYGVGLISWTPQNIDILCQFSHHLNVYANQTYYYITTDNNIGTKKRIIAQTSLSATPTHYVNTYYHREVYDKDSINIAKVGNIWFANDFKSTATKDYNFNIAGITKKNIFISIGLASISSANAQFTISINKQNSFQQVCYNNSRITANYRQFIPTSGNIVIGVNYNLPTITSVGYLDYIEIHATCSLAQNKGQVDFRNPEIVGNGNIAQYTFNTLGKKINIWEVTDRHNISKISGTRKDNNLIFTLTADSLREFISFDGSSFLSVTPNGKVVNQNLHALTNIDFIIITPPEFIAAAYKLAQHRRNEGITTAVVTTTQIYNEFSSGTTDISAIRNFLKMFYDRNDCPKNALLLGKTSYDPRQIEGIAPCYIPNFQGDNAVFAYTDNISTDNYFGKLADGKGNNNYGTMDMGIGRLPVNSLAQANAMVDKSILYASTEVLTKNAGQISNLSSWRNIIAFVADDDNEGTHIGNPEYVCKHTIDNKYPVYNVEKIYSDAYKKVSSSQGSRYPDVNKAINYRVNNGCLMMTYFGHGGDNGWSHERILTRSDINAWTNKYALPIFYTACCSFGHYDNNSSSPAELILLNTNGGGIGVIASTRESDSYNNQSLGKALHSYFLQNTNKQYLSIGEVYAKAQAEHRYEMYSYIGDPSVIPAHPKMNVITDSINDVHISTFTDTLKSLTYVKICGHIADANNNELSTFNGWIYPTIYDKINNITTIDNNHHDTTYQFKLLKSTIFKGKTKVENGKFSFAFMIPKDINYQYGLGKISYYAQGNSTDANGFQSVLIGGIKDTIIDDDEGPEIELYLNDEQFVNKGISTSTPIIKANIKDKSGINTAGAGIGHDIVAIIDDDIANAIVINDFFEFDENSFTSGKLAYTLSTIAEGKHKLKIRAWDIVNNMGEAEIEFEVVNNEDIQLAHVLNYPNPFTTQTSFYFEHNQPNNTLDIQISIFTISGKLVKTIQTSQYMNGYRNEAISWNGLDDYGNRLAKGVYIYKLRIRNENGDIAEKIEKIVLL